MKLLINKMNKGLFTVAILSLALVACGGGSVSGFSPLGSSAGLGPFIITSPDPVTSPIPDNTPTPSTTSANTLLTDIKIENTSGSTQSNIPFTFGHAFKVGDVPFGNSVIGQLSISSTALIPLQVNIKAKHTLGSSARHAVISGVLPTLAANTTETISLYTTTPLTNANAPITAATFLSTNPGFTSRVYIRVGAEVYSASARTLLAGSNIQWLSGPTVNEWIVAGPLLKTSDNTPHPHLTARFAIRSFTGSNKTKVDVTIENTKTYTAGSQNVRYDSIIFVGGVQVDNIAGLTHYHHARWHKSFWWGAAPGIHIKHNIPYLIATKAVPNYDQLTPSSTAIAQMVTDMAGEVGPMKRTLLGYYMPSAGGRIDIGPLPGWYVLYLLSMDKSAKESMLNIADSAGSWNMHYRDETDPGNANTYDLPVRIDKTGTSSFGGAYNRINTHGNFITTGPLPVPRCGEWDTTPECEVPYHPDTAHQPSLAYLPYLVTGDYFYLEELQFWATWNFLEIDPATRGFDQGLLHWQQVRAQAWSMRTLGQAAYISPDAHPLKLYFVDRVANNLTDYDNRHKVGGANYNQLGVVLSTTDSLSTGLRPWQDDFFTWSIGYLTELGFTQAQPFFDWKKTFVIGRMTGPGYCWITASAYALTIRDADAAPMYATFSEVYTKTFGFKGIDGSTLSSHTCALQPMATWITANSTNTGVFDNWGSGVFAMGTMLGYAGSPTGFPANLQPALAVSVISSNSAWTTFMGRSGPPNYSSQPQFAIVPRL